MVKKFAAVMSVLMCVLLCSCGLSRSDAKVYVKGTLDSVYLNKASDEYLMLVDSTQEECEKDYESGIRQEAEYFMSYTQIENVSDETVERISNIFRKIYPHSKYEVGDVTRSSDKYLVDVTVYPIDVIDNAYKNSLEQFEKQFGKRADAGEFDEISDTQREELWADGIIDAVEKELSHIGYLDPVTVSLQLVKTDDGYMIDDNDFIRIDELIIQY